MAKIKPLEDKILVQAIEIKYDGEEYLILSSRDLLAVVTK